MLREVNRWWKGVRWQYVISFSVWYGMYLMCRILSCPSFGSVYSNIQIHYANLRFSLLYNLFNILIMTWLQKKRKKIIRKVKRGWGSVLTAIEKKNERINAGEIGMNRRPNQTDSIHIHWFGCCVALLRCYLQTSF